MVSSARSFFVSGPVDKQTITSGHKVSARYCLSLYLFCALLLSNGSALFLFFRGSMLP